MTTLGVLALALVPAIGAAVVAWMPDPRLGSRAAALFAAAHGLHAGVWAWTQGSAGALAVAVNAVIATVILLAQPRRGLVRRDVALPLAWLASGCLVLLSTDARLILVGWLAPPALAWLTLSRLSSRQVRARRMVGAYLLLGGLPLAVAIGLFTWAAAQAGLDRPTDISGWSGGLLSPALAGTVFVLVAVSVMVRLGVPPLHSWMPALSEILPSGTMLALTGVQTAVQVMVRLALVPLPDAVPATGTVVLGVGVVGLVYGAVMAISQDRLRRVVAFVPVAQSSALLIGLAVGDPLSVAGAMTNAISVAVTSRGLMLVAAMIESRVGPVDLRRMTGVAHAAPRLATAAFMLALAALGLPGSLGFVGEDLLLQGLVHHRLPVAFLLVISTAVVAIALLRAMLKTCSGSAPEWASSVPDLLPRERAIVVLAMGALLVGLWPQLFVTIAQMH